MATVNITEGSIRLCAPCLAYRYPSGQWRVKTLPTAQQALTAYRQAIKPSSTLPPGTLVTLIDGNTTTQRLIS